MAGGGGGGGCGRRRRLIDTISNLCHAARYDLVAMTCKEFNRKSRISARSKLWASRDVAGHGPRVGLSIE